MSRYDEINAILDSLGEAATVEQIEYALRDHVGREVLAVLADRAAADEAFNGGTITEPLNISPAVFDAAHGKALEIRLPNGQLTAGVAVYAGQDAAIPGEQIFRVNQLGGMGGASVDASSPILSLFYATLTASTYPTPVEIGTDNGVMWGLLKGLQMMIGSNLEPDDSNLDPGQVALWFDSTNGAAKLKLKGKQANGTVVTAQIALA